MSSPSAKESGFTLLEVLVAVSILAVGILGMNAMLMSAGQHEQFAVSDRNAIRLAMRKMEELKGLAGTYTVDNFRTLSGVEITDSLPLDEQYEHFSGYTINYNIRGQADDGTISANSVVARVTVQWKSGGSQRQKTLTSVIYVK